jgi:hypothetical protein
MKRRGEVVAEREVEVQPPPRPRRITVSAEYRPLHKYLDGRYADTVVLTFAEIEDLLGFALPAVARMEREWWTGTDDAPEAQSRAWIQANRSAKPNLQASTVIFDRAAAFRT